MEVKRLEAEEKESTRALYAEAFPEDSARARDYYYETRMRKNTVYVIRNEREVEGMLCLNPCRVRFGDKDWDLSYIVAVATGKSIAGRGLCGAYS